MLAIAFVRWWYGAGWNAVMTSVRRRLDRTLASFSVPTLVRTIFYPWKRIITAPGSGLDAYIRAVGDNLMSRAVGFTVRSTVLLSAGFSLFGIALFGLVQVVLWPLIPLITIGLLVGSLII